MGGINNTKRTYDTMEEGSKGTLQNPTSQNIENVKKKQRLDAPNGTQVTQAASNATSDPSMANGIPTPNSANVPNVTSSSANGNPTDSSALIASSQVAPPPVSLQEALFGLGEVVQLPTVPPEGYQDFKEMISRVAQETWTGMVGIIDVLSSGRPIEADSSRLETAKTSQDFLRRRRLWDYVHEKRAKLIKLLVIAQWSRNMDDIKQLIDIFRFLAEYRDHFTRATTFAGHIKHMMKPLREKPLNLHLAMDLLANPKVHDMSDLGFLDPPPLKRSEMLRATREINAILTLRLSSYETLPEAFSNYFVRDGRVTFKVEEEFELSLSAGSDKHEEQLFFVSFRFCFTPGGDSMRDQIAQREVEVRVNRILGSDGLGACYEFLHDFTLTHKLSVFRAQAVKLQKTRWGGHIKYEQVHRALVLQYWTERPGPKSWIEIGMQKRRPQNQLINGDTLDTSQLSLRWHRQGKEIRDHDLEIDCAELSLETVLKDTIAAHMNCTLAQAKADVQALDSKQAGRPWMATHHESPVEPAECSLDVEFPDGKQITLSQESVTGRFAILPLSGLHTRYEHDLNNLSYPAVEIVAKLKQLRAWSSMERNRMTITMEGWTPFAMPRMSKEMVERNLGKETLKYQFYRPSTTWGENMVVCLSHHASGADVWRLVELRPKETEAGDKRPTNAFLSVEVNPIQRQMKIANVPQLRNAPGDSIQATGSLEDLGSHQFLRWVESQAAAMVSRDYDLKWLDGNRPQPIRRALVPLSGKTASRGRQQLLEGTSTSFNSVETAKILVNLKTVGIESLAACYGDKVLSVVDGVDHESGMVFTNSFARLERALPITGTSLSFEQGSIQIAKNDNRMLSIRLRTPIASSSIEVLLDRMSGFAHIASCVADLRKMGLQIENFDLTQITANVRPLIQNSIGTRGTTWTDEQLRVCFSCNDSGPTGVKFAENGPYRVLTPIFNDFLKQANGKFGPFVKELCAVAPVLCCIAEQRRLPDPRLTPWRVAKDHGTFSVAWGFRHSHMVGYSLQRAIVDGEACWKLYFYFEGGPKDKPSAEMPEHVQRMKEIGQAMYKRRGEAFIGLQSFLAVPFSEAPSLLWEILDAFTPHLHAWHDDEFEKVMASNNDGRAAPSRPTGAANGGARTSSASVQGGSNGKEREKDKEKERAKDTGGSVASTASRTPKQPTKQQVVVLD